MPSVPGGSYTISVEAHGFRTTVLKGIKVETDSTTTADATMQIGLADTVIVTASKYEEEVVDAPAMISVVSNQAIQASTSYSIAELLRAVPGMNVVQTSAMSFNTSSRSAAGVESQAQLALIDGRTIYIDFIGYIDWNNVAMGLDEVKQVEVMRGSASAIWGAYAMNGVINIVTKTPREMLGTSFALGFGTFDRSGGVAESNTGFLYSANVAHAQALNDRWAYKITAGGFAQDAFARPEGTMPNAYHTPYPSYPNRDMTQPKLDARVDYDLPDGKQRFTFGGGIGSIKGIYVTGMGPGDARHDIPGYGKVDYVRGALRISSFVNAVTYEMPLLLFRDSTGQIYPFGGDAQTYDVGFSNSHTIPAKHLISYGGNFRYNEFHHSAMPDATSRNEGGLISRMSFFSPSTSAGFSGCESTSLTI